ncbi:hypothetical protein [Phreatobacter stygius]|uniref:DUF1127 domain-containing protein n=1 Tax=Phreatobacter stygius TaxID=1940610 RepID=A0A4D7BCW3_9HYPH|nr:hypothetical protein [Phreatobacter stygius]QCI65832.1 hypothetical protein E8M01_17405 [Phreatobacter stygius]
MATITLDKLGTDAAPAPTRRSLKSFLRAGYEAFVEAQQLRAQTYVNGYLAHLSDEELAGLGMTRTQMIRRTRSMMSSF